MGDFNACSTKTPFFKAGEGVVPIVQSKLSETYSVRYFSRLMAWCIRDVWLRMNNCELCCIKSTFFLT